MKCSMALALCNVALWSSLALAGNRTAGDAIFTESPKGMAFQAISGLTDVALAKLLFPGKEAAADARLVALEDARAELTSARALVTEAEKAEKLTAYEKALTYVKKDAAAVRQLETEMTALAGRTPVTEAVRAREIEQAANALTEARKGLMQGSRAIQSSGLFSRIIRGVRVAGSALFILDAYSRVYLWDAVDRHPTVTPVGTYLYTKGMELFETK